KLVVTQNHGCINGVVRVPPSKYHLHRALIMGSLAEGTTRIKGVSETEHIADTLRSLRDFGIKVQKTDDGYHVNGGAYLPKNGTIRVGGSGSTLQFLHGLGCRSQRGEIVYVGN